MSNKKLPPDYIRYSSAGIQMVMIIGLFVFAGTWLDRKFATEKPWFTLGLSLFGVIVALVFMVKSFEKLGKENAREKAKKNRTKKKE
jgi:F0F1-type ATP synthase assembly protein I